MLKSSNVLIHLLAAPTLQIFLTPAADGVFVCWVVGPRVIPHVGPEPPLLLQHIAVIAHSLTSIDLIPPPLFLGLESGQHLTVLQSTLRQPFLDTLCLLLAVLTDPSLLLPSSQACSDAEIRLTLVSQMPVAPPVALQPLLLYCCWSLQLPCSRIFRHSPLRWLWLSLVCYVRW